MLVNDADLQTSDAPLSTLVTTHDVYWCIEPASGLSQWHQLQRETVSVHVAAFATAQAAQSAKESEKRSASKPYRMAGSKAILSLTGTLTKAPTSFSGGSSTVYFRRLVSQAARDTDVSEIVIVFDTPGGSAAGTADAAEAVRLAALLKPVTGFIEDMCCSAGIWIASQCTRIVANRTAMVGSIGTLLVVYDYSRAAAMQGVEPLVFSTSGLKGAGVPGTVITEEQKAHFQRIVDDLNSHFLAAVQSGRGLTDEQMSAASTADVWIGEAAVTMGLVDEIASLDSVLALAPTHPKTPASSGKERPSMKEFLSKLAARFSQRGKIQMAATVIGADDANLEKLADDLCAQVDAEVETQIAAHPVMKALESAGVTTEAQASALMADATAYREEAQAALQTQAIRAFGQEAGLARAQAMQALAASDKRAIAQGFAEAADAKFGTTAESGPARVSAPKQLPHAENAENVGQAESNWAQLTAAEKEIAARWKVNDASPEAVREKYAAETIARR